MDAELSDLDAVLNIVPRVIERLGKPSLLVNNASIYEGDDIGALNPPLWQRQMTINLTAPVFLADAFAKAVPEGVEGNIVNIIDQRVLKPTPRYFSYQLSKQALWCATQSLAQALAPRIRVNAIAPGPGHPQRQADRGRVAAPDRGGAARARRRAGGVRPHRPLFCGKPLDHGPNDLSRRRPAPRLADARHRPLRQTDMTPDTAHEDDRRDRTAGERVGSHRRRGQAAAERAGRLSHDRRATATSSMSARRGA